MTTPETTVDKLALASSIPDINELQSEFQRSNQNAYRERADLCDRVRFAWWKNQNDDGKKHDTEDEKAFPFDGASDTRIRLADEIIQDNCDILDAAFTRAQFTAEGLEVHDAPISSVISKALEWARNGGIRDLHEETRLASEYMQTYGWCVLHVGWERLISKRPHLITYDQVLQLSQSAKSEGLGTAAENLAEMILNEALDDDSAMVIQGLYPLLVKVQSPAILPSEITPLSKSKAREIVRGLRKDQTAYVPLPYVSKNNPVVSALRPYDEIFFPPETADLQRARVVFRRDFLSVPEVLARVKSQGWNEAWARKVIATAGDRSPNDLNDLPFQTNRLVLDSERRNMCEVVWAYARQVDDDGVECVYCTVFSPNVRESTDVPEPWGLHEPLNYPHGLLPFVVLRRERPNRRIWDSRGVPEIVMTWQQEKKVQRDSIIDRTSLGTMPPLKAPLRNMGKVYRLAPAKIAWVQRSDELEWMDPPPGGIQEAVEVMREIAMDANNYFGRISEGIDPIKAQLKQQNMANGYLTSWIEVFRQIFALMCEFLPDNDWLQITGSPAPMRGWEAIQRAYDWKLKFDVRDLNVDWMAAKLKAFAEFVLPADAAGVIDRAKFTALVASWIDPSIAKAVISDQASASQKLFSQVMNDLAMMSLGNEVTYSNEKDATAGRQLQFAQMILQNNPKYQEQLQRDQRFAELLQKWMQNKQFALQQQQNKQIGRIGVQPLNETAV